MTNFERFWKAYPKRNGKKPGKDFCSLWFEAKKPTTETVDATIDWIRVDIANREWCERQRPSKFYALPPDPKRFLKEGYWKGGIDSLGVKPLSRRKCRTCGEPAKSGYGDGWYCGTNGRCVNKVRT